MEWTYNPTSRIYQGHVDNGFLCANPHFDRFVKKEGWVPLKGIAVAYIWSQDEWTCQEMIEYNPATKALQFGTRKWKTTEESLEFQDYKGIPIHLLQHESKFAQGRIPRCLQQNIADLFSEVKMRIN